MSDRYRDNLLMGESRKRAGFRSHQPKVQGSQHNADAQKQKTESRAAPFTSFGSLDPERDRSLELRSTPAKHPGPASSQSADGAGPPMLNSARRRCMVRLHFWPRRFCRRCASDASYDSVGNAGSIDVTTTDISLRTDSIKRCKG